MKKMGWFKRMVAPVAVATAVTLAAQTSSALIIIAFGAGPALLQQKSYVKAGLWVAAGVSVAVLFAGVDAGAPILGIILMGDKDSTISDQELLKQGYSPEEVKIIDQDLMELHERMVSTTSDGRQLNQIVVCDIKRDSPESIREQLRSISPHIHDTTVDFYVERFCGARK